MKIGQAQRLLELSDLEKQNRQPVEKKIVSFVSGKGGTGKTVLSVNIAYALSLKGKKILLVDLDSNLANINILLNIYAENTLSNFLSGRKLFSDLVYRHSSNLHIIFGDSGNVDYPSPRKDLIEFIFAHLRKMQDDYDMIFIDCSAGISEDVIGILSYSDVNLIVTTTEPTAVMDAYVVLKFLKKNKLNKLNRVVINKCNSADDVESALGNLSQAAGHFLNEKLNSLGHINYDPQVNKSIIDQNILLENSPSSDSAKQIFELSERLEKFIQMVNNNQTAKPNSNRKSIKIS